MPLKIGQQSSGTNFSSGNNFCNYYNNPVKEATIAPTLLRGAGETVARLHLLSEFRAHGQSEKENS